MEIRGDIALLVAAVVIIGIGVHVALINNISSKTLHKGPDSIIEKYVNGCWIAKISKNLNDCKAHLTFIENQCKTNPDYYKAAACKDPRIAQMIKEQHQQFSN